MNTESSARQASEKRQPLKFRAGQVVAFRDVDGGWEYDKIQSIRREDETAFLDRGTGRRAMKYFRALTVKETGRMSTREQQAAQPAPEELEALVLKIVNSDPYREQTADALIRLIRQREAAFQEQIERENKRICELLEGSLEKGEKIDELETALAAVAQERTPLREAVERSLKLLDEIPQAELRVFKSREWLRAALAPPAQEEHPDEPELPRQTPNGQWLESDATEQPTEGRK